MGPQRYDLVRGSQQVGQDARVVDRDDELEQGQEHEYGGGKM